MSQNKIIITIHGGVLSGVYSTDPHAKVHLLDYDNIGAGDEMDQEDVEAEHKVKAARHRGDIPEGEKYNNVTYTEIY